MFLVTPDREAGNLGSKASSAARLAGTIAVDAMTRLDDAGHALDIEADQVAGTLLFVADNRRGRVERAQAGEAGAAEDAANGAPAERDLACDAPAVPAVAG